MGKVLCIYICPEKNQPMQSVQAVRAIMGAGLKGDRYAEGKGSWQKGQTGKRQVSLINIRAFIGTSFTPKESRRNIVTEGVELMGLIGKHFFIGNVLMRGTKYCEPCDLPGDLCGKRDFKDTFHDRAGILAEVLDDGVIGVGYEIFLTKDSR